MVGQNALIAVSGVSSGDSQELRQLGKVLVYLQHTDYSAPAWNVIVLEQHLYLRSRVKASATRTRCSNSGSFPVVVVTPKLKICKSAGVFSIDLPMLIYIVHALARRQPSSGQSVRLTPVFITCII